MKKNKLNKIKLNIIATILTLICISCAVNPLAPKVNGRTDIKEDNQKSGNPEPSNQKYQEETTVSRLESLTKKLEDQKNQETAKIAEIKEFDFIDTLANEIKPLYFDQVTEATKTNIKMQIKRILYSSLNYDKEKINKLKEILETLKGRPDYEDIIITFLYHTALRIQEQLDNHLELIQKEGESNDLLIHTEFDLRLKEKFKETLEKTVNEASQTIEDIKDYYLVKKNTEYNLSREQIEKIEDAKKKDYIASYINENYQIFDCATYSAEAKQKINLEN
ncbi:complement regulator-acquiring protein [Borreliella andersonii]|uniref:complement regulator-acquiring protein n=1 Tax=Borrelia andersonii TaxID=42109 RepID=UPI00292F7B9A|nr:complement regulator-acquiring protein [Borreliella andersonii]WNY70077.1 complement regulator-acquiring protein [Borreliella andersonii]